MVYGRKFWRHYLPRLKYHNPAIPMIVERTTDTTAPATMTLTFAPSSNPSPASSPAPIQSTASPTQSTAPTSSGTSQPQSKPQQAQTPGAPSSEGLASRIHSIDMKGRHESEILKELLKVCEGAVEIKATAEEEAELRAMDEQRVKSERDSKRSRLVRDEIKRKEDMLRQAKGELVRERAAA